MADRLNPGESLGINQSISSANGQYTVILQSDGNLVLYISGSEPIWASGTDGRDVSIAVMQGDGNFVLYGGSGAVWATGTHGNPGSFIVVQNDGNTVIYGPNGNALWASGTAGGGFGGKLVGWAIPTGDSIASTPHWADHTFATFEKYVNKWDCSSGTGTNDPDDPKTRLIARGSGSRTKARCIGGVPNSGIVWGGTGFCHQCTNRVLYPGHITVHRAAGYNISTGMFGTYGSDPAGWQAIKLRCGARFSLARIDDLDTVTPAPPDQLLALHKSESQEFAQKEEQPSNDDFYAAEELDYMAKVCALYDQPITSSTKAEEILASDLALLIEFVLQSRPNDSSLSLLQRAQQTFQQNAAFCNRAFQIGAIPASDAYGYLQGQIRLLFESFDSLLGDSAYDALFGISPDIISKIPSPFLKHNSCGCHTH
jgi:hypothetical protein